MISPLYDPTEVTKIPPELLPKNHPLNTKKRSQESMTDGNPLELKEVKRMKKERTEPHREYSMEREEVKRALRDDSTHFQQKRNEESSRRESPKEQTSPNKSEARVTEKVQKNGEGEMD